VKSRATEKFWQLYNALPAQIQQAARKNFQLFKTDPFHRSLRFKLLGGDVWSARVNDDYRAVCRRRGDTVFWFWIGKHGNYDDLLKQIL
jgi:hypothetical protein